MWVWSCKGWVGREQRKEARKQATWLKQLCRLEEDKVNKVVRGKPAMAGTCSTGFVARAARAGLAERPKLPSWKPLPAPLALLK